MIIKKRTGKLISNRVFRSRARGMMFRKRLRENESLLLEIPKESRFRASVHMFFVFFPIDIVWLNQDMKVVDIAENLLPFTPFRMPKKKAKYILELPSRDVREKTIRVGDVMKLN